MSVIAGQESIHEDISWDQISLHPTVLTYGCIPHDCNEIYATNLTKKFYNMIATLQVQISGPTDRHMQDTLFAVCVPGEEGEQSIGHFAMTMRDGKSAKTLFSKCTKKLDQSDDSMMCCDDVKSSGARHGLFWKTQGEGKEQESRLSVH